MSCRIAGVAYFVSVIIFTVCPGNVMHFAIVCQSTVPASVSSSVPAFSHGKKNHNRQQLTTSQGRIMLSFFHFLLYLDKLPERSKHSYHSSGK
jgi:hypothetical protein